MTRFSPRATSRPGPSSRPEIQELGREERGQRVTGKGDRYLTRVLGEAAAGAGRTHTFLGARYRRIARRRGRRKAIVAVGRSIVTIVWHLLADPEATFKDLGADHYDQQLSTTAKIRSHIRGFEALDYRVTLDPAA